MHENQRVGEMAEEVLKRQARDRAGRTGETFEEAFQAVIATGAGQQLEEVRDGPHKDERAREWQEDSRRERAEERRSAGRPAT